MKYEYETSWRSEMRKPDKLYKSLLYGPKHKYNTVFMLTNMLS